MASYDPNQQQQWLPPETPASYGGVPADAQPMTEGDRWALIALTISLTIVMVCIPGLNCLVYFAPLGAGIVALTRARSAADPQRARTYGWIATGIGVVILLAFLAIVVLYGALIFSMIQQGEFRNLR